MPRKFFYESFARSGIACRFGSCKSTNLILESSHNEKELLLKVAEGDRVAFGHLFNRYYGTVYSASMRFLKVHELAEDMVQTSFLKIWEKRGMLTDVDRFDSYLFRVARNEVADHFRKLNTREKHQQRIREMFEEESGSPEDLLISKQKRALIADVIDSLPAQQRTAYRLSRDKGLSYQEIAEKMDLSVNTVKVHISLALKTLRQFFLKHKDEYLLVWLIVFTLKLFFKQI